MVISSIVMAWVSSLKQIFAPVPFCQSMGVIVTTCSGFTYCPAILTSRISPPHATDYHSGWGRNLSTHLPLQQLLDPVHGFLPTHVLLDCQAFDRLDYSLWRTLRLQVGLQDVEIIVEPL